MNFIAPCLLLTLLAIPQFAAAQKMPTEVHDNLMKLVGTWEIETGVNGQDISTVVTLKWSEDRNTIHYEASGSSLKTGQDNVTFSGILGWDGSRQLVTEYSYNSLGETMQATHRISKSLWKSRTRSVSFKDGTPVTEESLRVFQWNRHDHLKINVTNRKQNDDALPDQTYTFRPVAAGSSATAIRLIKDSIVRWKKNWQDQNTAALAGEFASHSVRVLGRNLRPYSGAEAIRRSFDEALEGAGDATNTELTADVRHARFVDNKHVIGDGTFIITKADGEVVKRGKWANVFIANEDRTDIRLLMEAAFEHLPLDAVANRSLPPAGLTLPDPPKLKDTALQAMIERSIARYAEGVLNSNSELVANEFTVDGVRSVSEMPAAYRGREAILDSLRIANEGSSPYAKTRLKVVVLGARRISDQLAIANGLWQAVNDQGEVIDYGQWGNVWWIKAGEVKLLQESAGSYLP